MLNREIKQKNQFFIIKKYGAAIAIVLFPVFFIISNALQPDLFSPSMHRTLDEVVERFKDNSWLHFAHFLEWLSAPLLILLALHMMKKIKGKAKWVGLIGGILAIMGAVILATSKGALCFTLSAFDTLSDKEIALIRPVLEVLLLKRGYLIFLWLLPILPIGFLLLSIGLYLEKAVPRWQSIPLIFGSLLLANPEIEVINLSASIILAFALIPYAYNSIKEVKK